MWLTQIPGLPISYGLSRHFRAAVLLCGPWNHLRVVNFVHDRTVGLFALVLERRYLAGMFPKLNVMAIHKLFCPLYSLFVAITVDGDRSEKLAVGPDDVSAVICHVMHPCVWREHATLSVTDGCQGRSGDC
jgi:hypothetical protein